MQDVRQPDNETFWLQLYHGAAGEQGRGVMVLFSISAEFGRVHCVTRRPANSAQPPAFCAAVRSRLMNARLTGIRQVANDRVVELQFVNDKGTHALVAEIMGKHSNLVLVDVNARILSAVKWVGPEKSKRPIISGKTYTWPPVLDEAALEAPELLKPPDWEEWTQLHSNKVSPFLRGLVAAGPLQTNWEPGIVEGDGAYPVPCATGEQKWLPRASISVALEQFYSRAVLANRIEVLRASLLGSLRRIASAREEALVELKRILEEGAFAEKWQRYGELILAFGFGLTPGSERLEAYDYDGAPVMIPVDPELGPKDNALRYFEKAKKAKGRVSTLEDQSGRLREDRENILALIERVSSTERLDQLEDLQEEAKKRRWMISQVHVKSKEDRPYEGHRIRELLGPDGIRVLYGENAESNDYLTLRVAKPSDYWVHVRGHTSAHVVIVTGNHPERIGPHQIQFAAKVAVMNSTCKHAGFVPVDYTLKRYVRKPRGAANGAALYTNEKTIHVES